MIVIDKQCLKFLLKGRQVTVDVRREYRKGRTYALGLSHRKAVCRVLIVDVRAVEDGWRLTIRQLTEQPGTFLTPPGVFRGDYTHDVQRSWREEPEGVDGEAQQKLTGLGTFRWQQERSRREGERERMFLWERLLELERRYKAGEASLGPDLRVVRQKLQAATKRTAA